MFKFIIIILLIGLVASLISGLVFLFKDVGTTRRTLHSLGVRVALAIALMATTVYGFYSGQLKMGAPWDARKFQAAQPANSTLPSDKAATSDKQKAALGTPSAANVSDANDVTGLSNEASLDDVNKKE